MSGAADGQDANGLQLKKNRADHFKFMALCLGKLAKIQILIYSLFKKLSSFVIFLLLSSISISRITKVLSFFFFFFFWGGGGAVLTDIFYVI